MTTFTSLTGSRAVAFSKKAAIAAVSAAAVSLFSLSASASATVAISQTVEYGDLDLSRTADAERLYRRLRVASQKACGTFNRGAGVLINTRSACEEKALADAVTDVNHPTLTAVHTSRSDVKLAQRVKSEAPKS